MEKWRNHGRVGVVFQSAFSDYLAVSDAHTPVGAAVTMEKSSSDTGEGGMKPISEDYIKLAEKTMESTAKAFALVAEESAASIRRLMGDAKRKEKPRLEPQVSRISPLLLLPPSPTPLFDEKLELCFVQPTVVVVVVAVVVVDGPIDHYCFRCRYVGRSVGPALMRARFSSIGWSLDPALIRARHYSIPSV